MFSQTETLVTRIIDVANNVSSTSVVCNNVHYCRTVPSIIFSCASTVFLCTWVAVHPDVPANPHAPWWKTPIRPVIENRVVLMLLAFLAPEYIFGCAYVDWMDSCWRVKKIMRQYPDCTWTETHAQLLRMNGFQIVKKDGSSYRLGWATPAPKSHAHILKIPIEEIEDRSKADFVAKVVTMVQTIWFVLQILNRAIQGLTVTELELTTLSHATLNVIIFWLWWNKPVNVGFPFKLYPIDDESKRQGKEEESETKVDETKGCRVESESSTRRRRRLPARVILGAYIGSPDLTPGWITFMFGMIISGTFGAIHCLAWNAHFPTDAESKLWRGSATIVTVAPFVAFVLAMTLDLPMRTRKPASRLLYAALVPYVFARLCLLAIALSTLRALSYKAFLIPSWTRFIPHI